MTYWNVFVGGNNSFGMICFWRFKKNLYRQPWTHKTRTYLLTYVTLTVTESLSIRSTYLRRKKGYNCHLQYPHQNFKHSIEEISRNSKSWLKNLSSKRRYKSKFNQIWSHLKVKSSKWRTVWYDTCGSRKSENIRTGSLRVGLLLQWKLICHDGFLRKHRFWFLTIYS